MKIRCHCGTAIIDQTDDVPNKAHLIPDQDWLATLDAIDAEVLLPLSGGLIGEDAASMRTRSIIGRAARGVWQCRECGRLYLDGPDGRLRCFAPDDLNPDRDALQRSV